MQINNSRSNLLGLAFLVVLSTVAMTVVPTVTAYAQGTTTQQPNTLTAVGDAEARARPDLAVVRLGVQTEATTAAEAREENAAIVTRVINALRALNIPERQIETATFQIYPIRRFEDEDQRGEPPIVGYRVVNTVSVRTENLNLVPRIIDAAVGAGANTVESVDFRLRDEDAARQNALRQAVDNATENARTMAQALGVRLVRVHQVQQGGVGVMPPPFPVFRGVAAETGTATPIFPGEVTVNATVTLTYIIQ